MFVDRIRLPFLKFLGKDLGIYRYDGVPVSSTHVATFALGVEPQALFGEGAAQKQRQIATEYGQYFARWGASLDQHSGSFPGKMNGDLLDDTDVRTESEYSQRFNGPGTPETNALLSVFQTSLNTLDKLLPLDYDPTSQQTTVKLKDLSVYQILRSLDILLTERDAQLRPESKNLIKSMVNHPTARLVTDPVKKPLRNTLMHYGPDTRIDLTRLSLGQPLYGLVEQCFSMAPAPFDALLTTLIKEVAFQMNTWAGL
jgi:hypothetical protein